MSPFSPPVPAPGAKSPSAWGEHEPLRIADRALWFVFALAVVLQLLTWSRVEGYQLADSVEYMDRAKMVVDGKPFDPRTPRPFTFSGLMSPLFWVAKAIQIESYAGVVVAMRLVQMLVGLATIFVTARIGSRIGGRRLGLACAVFMAANVSFLRFTISPVSDPEAMLLMALGVESLLLPRTKKRGFVTGFYLGGSILFTYKCIPMVGAILAGVFVRERLKHLAWLRSAVLGIVTCISVAAAVDTKVYGNFGSSIGGYFWTNLVSIVSKRVYHLGFEDEGRWIYNRFSLAEKIDQVANEAGDFRSVDGESFYFEEIGSQFFSWPLLALVFLGMLLALRRWRYPETLFLFVVAFNFLLLNDKGSKSFRLLLPLLPMICVLGGLGWSAVRGFSTLAPGGNLLRSVFAGSVVFVGILMTPGMLLNLNLREHSGYWRAMEIVNREAAHEREALRAAGLEAPPRKVGSAYYWAVSLRQTRDVELIRLPMEMLTYVRRQDREKYDPVREAMLGQIADYDWFLAHMQVLWQSPDIMEVVNRTFEVHDVLYDADTYGGLAPICVLRRRDGPARRSFYDLRTGVAPEEAARFRQGLQHPSGQRFGYEAPEGGRQELELLGFDVETGFGGGDLVWITYHWYAHTDGITDFELLDRITDWDGSAGFVGMDGHRPAYRVYDTSKWRAGDLLSESYPRWFPRHPRLFGGAHRRGELIPARLWMSVQRGRGGEEPVVRAAPLSDDGSRALEPAGPRPGEEGQAFFWAGDGALWDLEGRIAVGGFWVPVPSGMRLADDGRPIPALPGAEP